MGKNAVEGGGETKPRRKGARQLVKLRENARPRIIEPSGD